MRTFHIGGTASQVFKQPQIKAKYDGIVRYNDLRLVELEDGNNIVLNKNGSISIIAEDGRELETHNLVIGSVISVKNGGKVKKGDAFVAVGPLQRAHPFRKGRHASSSWTSSRASP